MSFCSTVKSELRNIPPVCGECDGYLSQGKAFLSQNDFHGDIPIRDCCLSSFFRGAFIACGNISDPEREYHLEFKASSQRSAEEFADLMSESGFGFKTVKRMDRYAVYIKESEQIEDILTMIGAVKSSMDLMETKIVKDVRNNINRKTNCETANIGRTVDAAAKQVENIKLISRRMGLECLPERLRTAARLRLDNPEASLNELAALPQNNLSKSGLYHRLNKISQIAGGLG
ncbi:MAG: DNA-binding protein WhiA [Oscillospiraceae bacterium]|nr:DNA-binding protein WhiA [Oscillospiraceae bacterium]